MLISLWFGWFSVIVTSYNFVKAARVWLMESSLHLPTTCFASVTIVHHFLNVIIRLGQTGTARLYKHIAQEHYTRTVAP